LLIANLLTFVALAIPLPDAVRWLRHGAPFALLIAVAQALVEGPRWQMVPAYALSALFFLVWLLQTIAPAGTPAGQKRINHLAVALGVLGLAVSIILPIMIPVFPLSASPWTLRNWHADLSLGGCGSSGGLHR
jgi:hypothetical protein